MKSFSLPMISKPQIWAPAIEFLDNHRFHHLSIPSTFSSMYPLSLPFIHFSLPCIHFLPHFHSCRFPHGQPTTIGPILSCQQYPLLKYPARLFMSMFSLFSIFNSFFSNLILSSIISCFSHISFFSYLFLLISLPSHSLLSHFSHHLLSNFPRRPCGSQPLVHAINLNISSQKPSKISKIPIQILQISIFSTPTFPYSYLNTLLPLLVYPRYLLPNGAPYLYALPHD